MASNKHRTTVLAENKVISGIKYEIAEKDVIVQGSNSLPLTKEVSLIFSSFSNVIDDLYQVDINKHNTILPRQHFLFWLVCLS